MKYHNLVLKHIQNLIKEVNGEVPKTEFN